MPYDGGAMCPAQQVPVHSPARLVSIQRPAGDKRGNSEQRAVTKDGLLKKGRGGGQGASPCALVPAMHDKETCIAGR